MTDKSVMYYLLIVTIIYFYSAYANDSRNLVIVIVSQNNVYHSNLAENLKTNIRFQAKELQISPVIHLTHKDFPDISGDWTFLPIIPKLLSIHSRNSSWVVFLEDRTSVNLKALNSVLAKYDTNEEVWYGSAIYDHEATIIHHFAFYDNPHDFKYPNVASGFVMSIPLLKRINAKLIKQSKEDNNNDFSIDSAHELAVFIWDEGNGIALQNNDAFCVNEDMALDGENICATYPKKFKACAEIPTDDSLYIAVKTCGKFHEDRVPVVRKTWANFAPRLTFFSDIKDETIPTISLGIPNTENGHCAKTLAIIKHVAKEIENLREIDWIVLADDDTILSISRLRHLLSCYSPAGSRAPLALGERYGYHVALPQDDCLLSPDTCSTAATTGYNYLTGGAALVFSRPALLALAQATVTGRCTCASLGSPDDMVLGICLDRLGIAVVHSGDFHQARPNDYSPTYLSSQTPVSFHKHWMIDPVKVYNKWFLQEELSMQKKDQSLMKNYRGEL